MEKWNLYVLRYAGSGNYYVGTTPNFEDRMLIHWRRTSTDNNLPKWSSENKSTEGFKYYWFNINCKGVSQSQAEHCENALADRIKEKIEMINNEASIRKTHVGNGKFVDGKENNYDIVIKLKCPNNVLIDTEIEKILKTPKPFELKTKNQNCYMIKCFEIGNVREYDSNSNDCNEQWSEVASVEFSDDNKEK